MVGQDTLLRLYPYICREYENHLEGFALRLSNNDQSTFTDEEVLTIYLFGLIKGQKTVQSIYQYTTDHLKDWFPALPSYGGFVQRLNRLADVFPVFLEQVLGAAPAQTMMESVRLVDSMPIIMAHERRSSQACVASELANKGYCASKKMFYYGLHVVGLCRRGTMPLPEYVGLTPGSENDLVALRHIVGHLSDSHLYADKAYCDAQLAKDLAQKQNVGLFTPIKKQKGQDELPMTDQVFSESISRVRQPIESLFNWIEEKTGIQCASKVRSYQGLLVHVFGRLTAAMFLLLVNP